MSPELRDRPTELPIDEPGTGTGSGQPGGGQPAGGGPAEEIGPVGTRLGHDPSELGTEVADQGDIVYPTPEATNPKSM
ncbi:MAG: hypothetical protein M3N29_10715 [Chloroflexota bacterium]|nr:hypothetical protein [Chloroflexota bacterium]